MWSLYVQKGEAVEAESLPPLVFSNGKTQEDVVKEIVAAIAQGSRLIFLKGMCGTGKSAIALHLAKEIGRTSIVVPIKSLQEQYTNDYSDAMYVLNKEQTKKLKIASIFGRQNFPCTYMKENIIPVQRLVKEKNAQLDDIFAGTATKAITHFVRENDESCDNDQLPCKIELKEKNFSAIKEYLKKNPAVKLTDFFSIQDVTRNSVASVCPYWSPIVPKEYDLHFEGAQKILYRGLDGIDFVMHQRKRGCPYYEQYAAYTDSDVIIFNAHKYKIETIMNRKPSTELEIIDECDEFLDSFATQERISINRLLNALSIVPDHASIKELIDITSTLKIKYKPSEEIYPVAGSLVEELLKTMLGSSELLYELAIDEHSYAFHLEEVAKLFADYLGESYFSVEKKDEDVIINIVTTNLKKRFSEMTAKNKVMIFMSGTLHSPEVLRTIFGIEHSVIIEAETKQQGELIPCRHGSELDCKYSNFQTQYITREDYLRVFSKTVTCAKKPALVHLTSFTDLPDDKEKYMYELDNLPTQNEVMNQQLADPLGERIRAFKNKEFDILFTTKCNRGVDFPGDRCNSIIISRFPYPNISALFWKILKKTHPQHFMQFYMDKSRRELLQKIYRGLRSKNDRVYLLSPDSRVLDFKMS